MGTRPRCGISSNASAIDDDGTRTCCLHFLENVGGKNDRFAFAHLADERSHFLPHDVDRHRAEVLHVQTLHQLLVDLHAHLNQIRLTLRRDGRLRRRLRERRRGNATPFAVAIPVPVAVFSFE